MVRYGGEIDVVVEKGPSDSLDAVGCWILRKEGGEGSTDLTGCSRFCLHSDVSSSSRHAFLALLLFFLALFVSPLWEPTPALPLRLLTTLSNLSPAL